MENRINRCCCGEPEGNIIICVFDHVIRFHVSEGTLGAKYNFPLPNIDAMAAGFGMPHEYELQIEDMNFFNDFSWNFRMFIRGVSGPSSDLQTGSLSFGLINNFGGSYQLVQAKINIRPVTNPIHTQINGFYDPRMVAEVCVLNDIITDHSQFKCPPHSPCYTSNDPGDIPNWGSLDDWAITTDNQLGGSVTELPTGDGASLFAASGILQTGDGFAGIARAFSRTNANTRTGFFEAQFNISTVGSLDVTTTVGIGTSFLVTPVIPTFAYTSPSIPNGPDGGVQTDVRVEFFHKNFRRIEFRTFFGGVEVDFFEGRVVGVNNDNYNPCFLDVFILHTVADAGLGESSTAIVSETVGGHF